MITWACLNLPFFKHSEEDTTTFPTVVGNSKKLPTKRHLWLEYFWFKHAMSFSPDSNSTSKHLLQAFWLGQLVHFMFGEPPKAPEIHRVMKWLQLRFKVDSAIQAIRVSSCFGTVFLKVWLEFLLWKLQNCWVISCQITDCWELNDWKRIFLKI